MRILNVTQSYAPFFEFGGPPEKVRALSEGLAQLGHEVTVLTADWGLERRAAQLPGEPPAENSPFAGELVSLPRGQLESRPASLFARPPANF